MGIKDRIDKLQRQRGPQAGGVVSELPGGGYLRGGRIYEPGELPPGGYLLVPGELPPAEWDHWAVAVHEAQKNLL